MLQLKYLQFTVVNIEPFFHKVTQDLTVLSIIFIESVTWSFSIYFCLKITFNQRRELFYSSVLCVHDSCMNNKCTLAIVIRSNSIPTIAIMRGVTPKLHLCYGCNFGAISKLHMDTITSTQLQCCSYQNW